MESVSYNLQTYKSEHSVCKMSVWKSTDLVRSVKKVLWNPSVVLENH